jgi:protein CpxP
MKRLMMIAALIMISAAQMIAQGNGPKKTPEQRADNFANKAEKDLGLSAEQKTKVRDLALTRAKKMDELRTKYKGKEGDKQVWKDERKKVRDEFHAGMKQVLSPEQYAKWEAQRKKQAEKKGNKGGKGGKKGKGGKGGKGGKTDSTPAPAPAPQGATDGRDNDDPELDGE